MATITFNIAREEAWYEAAAGTGSSVTDDVLVEYEDVLTKEQVVLALEKIIKRVINDDAQV